MMAIMPGKYQHYILLEETLELWRSYDALGLHETPINHYITRFITINTIK